MGIVPLSLKLREVEMRIEKGEELNTILPIISMLSDELNNVVKLISAETLEKSS
jgi:hypothetical protein